MGDVTREEYKSEDKRWSFNTAITIYDYGKPCVELSMKKPRNTTWEVTVNEDEIMVYATMEVFYEVAVCFAKLLSSGKLRGGSDD